MYGINLKTEVFLSEIITDIKSLTKEKFICKQNLGRYFTFAPKICMLSGLISENKL